MTLRLKRGTDEQRLAIVFEEGELVYTTDTKKLYAGDGETVGGIPIASAGILDQDIVLNNYDITGAGDINITGTVTATTFVGDGSGLTNLPGSIGGIAEGQLYNIGIVGNDSTVIVDNNTNTFTGILNGTVVNNLGETILDPSIGYIKVSDFITTANTLVFKRDDTEIGDVNIEIRANEDNPRISLVYNSTTDLSLSNSSLGRITFGRNDSINGFVPVTNIISNNEAFQVYHSPTIDYANGSNWLTFKNNMFGIGVFTPTHTLEVNGNAKVGSTLLLGSLTLTERNNLVSPQNGTIIYNTTVNRFQGYQNGSWINLDTGEAA